MLLRSGKNWVVDFFVSRGWLVKRRLKVRGRPSSWNLLSTVPAECLEDRTLLSTITVTSLADSLNAGSGVTLRDAIQAANTDTSVDGSVAGAAGVQNVIVFQSGLTGTISLNAGLGQMTISSSLKIDGLGAASTIVDAQHNSRIFNITSAAGDITLDGLTLENGKTTDNGAHAPSIPGTGEGGAVRSVTTGILTVNNSTLSGNSTTGDYAFGGAIYSSGTMSVTGTLLSGNSTTGKYSSGGAIFSQSALTVAGSTLSANFTTGTSGLGGAIKGNGAITVANSSLSGNSTAGSGAYGGAIASYAALTVTNSTLSANSTTASSAMGGAIRGNGAMTVTDSTLSGNSTLGTGSYGGGIASNGSLTVTISTVSGNSTAGTNGSGGGIRCNGPLNVTNSTLYENSTAGQHANGGGIEAIGTTTITNSTVVQNHASGATAGGIYHDLVDGTAITLRNTIVAQNTDNGTAPDTNVAPVTNAIFVQYSLIGDNAGSSLTAAPVGTPDSNGNLIGTHAAPIDPLLGLLANNGGPTQTMALLPGSPAINAGSDVLAVDPAAGNAPLTTDQRGPGFSRFFGTVDMGAYEKVSLLIDTTPITSHTAFVGSSTGNVVLATFISPIPLQGLTTPLDDPLGAKGTEALGVSGNHVAGVYYDSSNVQHGFFYDGSTATFKTVDPPGATATNPRGVDGDESVGQFTNASGEHGFLFNNSTGSYLILDPPASTDTIPEAISGNFVVGSCQIGSVIHGFLYNIAAATYTTFDPPTSNDTLPLAISGNIVGGYYVGTGGRHSFEYDLSTATITTFMPPGSTDDSVMGVSDGNVIGFTEGGRIFHGYLYNGSQFTALNAPGSNTNVRAISGNNIAGFFFDARGEHGFLYNIVTSAYTTIDPPGSTSTDIEAVSGNNLAGFYSDSNGNKHGFLFQVPAVESDFTAQVNWGGPLIGTPTVSVQLVSQGPASSTWEVVGSAVYSSVGNKAVVVTVNDAGSTIQTSRTSFNVVIGTPPAAFSFAGEYAVSTSGSATQTLASITQNGDQLSLSATANATATVVASPAQLLIGGAVAGTYQNSTLTFPSGPYAGQVWTKLDLPANYVSSLGGQAQVIQNSDTSLTFINTSGQSSPGHWISPTQVIATAFGNEIGTPGNGKIVWSTGEVWLEDAILPGTDGGTGATAISAVTLPVTVTDYLIAGHTAHVIQNGTNTAAFVNEHGTIVMGFLSSPTKATVPDWGNDVATFSAGKITWSDGAVWVLTTTAAPQITVTDYMISGLVSHVIQNGGNTAVFVNEKGAIVLGTMNSPTQATVSAWNNDVATFGTGKINWSDGAVWVLSPTAPAPITVGDYSIAGLTAHVIQNGTNTLAFVNEHGTVVLGNWISATQANVPDWGNDVATFSSDKINWSDGAVWNLTTTAAPQITVADYTIAGLTSHVIQNGGNTAVFVNEKGGMVLGALSSSTRAVVALWGNDVAMFNSSKINWSDGSIWNLAASEPPPVIVTDYTISGQTAHVIQNGGSTLVFVNEHSTVVLGNWINATQANVPDWGNDVATFSTGKITWSDGAIWTLTTMAAPQITVTDYANASNALTAHLIENGTSTAVFVNEHGAMVLGTLTSSMRAQVTDWGNDVASIGNTQINWSDGSVWQLSPAAPPLLATFTAANDAVSHVQLVSATTLLGRDGPLIGLIGTRLNGKITWSNGSVWDNLDQSALNALIEMATGYP